MNTEGGGLILWKIGENRRFAGAQASAFFTPRSDDARRVDMERDKTSGGTSGNMVDRIEELESVLSDWLDCADTPSEWMRCRNNAKIALRRDASPTTYSFQSSSGTSWGGINENVG